VNLSGQFRAVHSAAIIKLAFFGGSACLVGLWSKTTLKSLLPGSILLLAVATLTGTAWFTLALPTLVFWYYASLTIGLLLAWRFHSSRVFFALVVLLLAQQALAVFASGRGGLGGPGHAALQAVAVLLPVNFVLLSLERERGFTASGIATRSLFLFVQSVVVAVLGTSGSSATTVRAQHAAASVPLPGYVWFSFAGAAVILLARFLLFRKPVESALFWSLGGFFLAFHAGAAGRIATTYFAVSALILAISIIETSYVLAYHDELTTLPSRRAFNEAVLRLQAPYSIAMVDIDHFKKFNDTYGHDTGDEVLRLVASKLARVSGGGQAYRYGGEEFAVVFSGRANGDAVDHLEQLRGTIEASSFRMRGGDRRQAPRGPDRRNQRSRGRTSTGHAIRKIAQAAPNASTELSVTVSIGAATSTREGPDPEQVIRAADKALYRAKAAGRNRVETSAASRRRTRFKAAGIA
jgi:GGDEF domain-containing protein